MAFKFNAVFNLLIKLLNSFAADFITVFSKLYIGLLALGVYDYANGYDYFYSLSSSQSPAIAFYFRIIIYFSSLLFILSIFPRLSLSVLIMFFYIYEFCWGSGLSVYSTNIAAFVLFAILILFLREKTTSLKSAQNIRAFSLFLIAALGVVYFSSALSKIYSQGISWTSGETLKAYLYEGYLFNPSSLKLFLIDSPVLLSTLSILTLAWEACFFSAVFLPRKFKIAFLISGLIFHTVILFTLGPNFFYFFIPFYFGFVPLIQSKNSYV
jgi:hypothetical protein